MSSPRAAATALSSYLCGTHSGLLGAARAARHGRRPAPLAAVAAESHLALNGVEPATVVALERAAWEPQPEAGPLRAALAALAADPAVVDVVVFGSQARGTTTGFSDVDAILVLEDDVADREDALRRLRPQVLAAQRAVLTYQPMQHHGFEVVTPRLLRQADTALALPPPALEGAKSVLGSELRFGFSQASFDAATPFRAIAGSLRGLGSWPRHPWAVHRVVSMFELLPVLYLQAKDVMTPKWQSFEHARGEFGRRWRAYDALFDVRREWPREPRPLLARSVRLARNPWLAVAMWTRLPQRAPAQVRRRLDDRLLHDLRSLVTTMEERIG